MDGKAALVTGAASGIGCDLALALGRQGVHLTVSRLRRAALSLSPLHERTRAISDLTRSWPT